MPEAPPVVWVIDDDDAMRKSLRFMLDDAGFTVHTMPTARSFLDAYRPAEHECVIADLRLPELDGLELVRELRARGMDVPVVMLSGHATVRSAVSAMHLGVVDFLEKPVGRGVLLGRVAEAVRLSGPTRQQSREAAAVRGKLATLSPRERELLGLVVEGHTSKQIARHVHLAEKTVANNRARLMEKMGAVNAADLVRMAVMADGR